jgi:ATP-dependent Clp protease adaptor protein ClpS
MVKEKVIIKKLRTDNSDEVKRLVLHNDNFNHFDFVIRSLIDVCGHDEEQAYQCTIIAHYKGSCEIRKGSFKELMTSHKELTFRNLTVSIE